MLENNNKRRLLVYYNISPNKLSQYSIRQSLLRYKKLKKTKYYNKLSNFFIRN